MADRLTEAEVAEDLPQSFILVIDVEGIHHHGFTHGGHGIYHVVALGLVLLQHRQIFTKHRLGFVGHFPIGELEVLDFNLWHIEFINPADVGELLASGVYLVEVGIGHQLATFSRVGNQNVGFQGRHHRPL